MKHKFLRLILQYTFLVLTGMGSFLFSSAQEYIFNHFTTKDGLSSNTVFAVMRDAQGYLWIGTETGLQRYDGYNFIYPRFGINDNSTFSHAVHQIVQDRKGRMWIRMGATVGVFDTHTFEFRITPQHYLHPYSILDYRLTTDEDGNVILIAIGNTWLVFNEKKFSFEEGEASFSLPKPFAIRNITADKKNHLLWVLGDQGILAYDIKKKTLITSSHNPDSLPLVNDPKVNHFALSLFIDSRRRYWIVNWDMDPGHIRQNLYCYDEAKRKFTHDPDNIYNLPDRYYEFNAISELNRSDIVVYGRSALFLNPGSGFVRFYESNSSFDINYGIVYQVTEDKDKLLWVATDNGLYNTNIEAKQTQHLILDKTKRPSDIDCVYPYLNKEGRQEIWAGTWGGRGILTFGNRVNENSSAKLYDRDIMNTDYASVWDIAQHSRDHRVWITCQHGLIQIFNPATGKSEYLKPTAFAGRTIRTVAEDRQGNMWFGVQSGNIVKWNYGSTTEDSSFHIISNTGSMIFDLFVDAKGLIWTSSPAKGVIVFDPVTNKPLHHYATGKGLGSLSDNGIMNILQLDDTTFALAGDVLNLLNSKTGLAKLAIPSGKPTGKVLSMQLDNKGQLWLSTITGIYRYNRRTDTYKMYGQQDGLLDVMNENTVLNASMKMDNGNLVFAGGQNLVVFNPDQFTNTTPPTNVTITGFSLFNRNLPVDSLLKFKEIDFSHDQNSFTVRFASLNFREANKLTYFYKLEGADKDWIAADQFQAAYSLLPPGNYTFKVRAQNEEGTYSNDTTELQIYIRPSFWQSIWFYLLLAAATTGLLYYLHWSRIQRILHVERVRTRLARDLHDDMGSTLSTINILSNMALQKAGKDEKTTKEFISRIGNNSSRMMEAMDDIVWSINPVNDSMQKVTARMKEFAGNALEAKDIDYSFHIDEEVKDLHFDMDARRSIFLIFKEAVNNILKYAEATDVNIVMDIKKKEMRLLVEDNGKGFDPAKPTSASRGNGVRNMQKRAEAMKGSLKIDTVLGKGTSLLLCVPAR